METIKKHFPNIYNHCLSQGYDVTKECIPVVPAQHYFMGGIKVNSSSKTSMDHLYAIGETSCNGVHGANRLASNSLLESLVFAKRAAKEISDTYDTVNITTTPDLSSYGSLADIEEEYIAIVKNEINKMNGDNKDE